MSSVYRQIYLSSLISNLGYSHLTLNYWTLFKLELRHVKTLVIVTRRRNCRRRRCDVDVANVCIGDLNDVCSIWVWGSTFLTIGARAGPRHCHFHRLSIRNNLTFLLRQFKKNYAKKRKGFYQTWQRKIYWPSANFNTFKSSAKNVTNIVYESD